MRFHSQTPSPQFSSPRLSRRAAAASAAVPSARQSRAVHLGLGPVGRPPPHHTARRERPERSTNLVYSSLKLNPQFWFPKPLLTLHQSSSAAPLCRPSARFERAFHLRMWPVHAAEPDPPTTHQKRRPTNMPLESCLLVHSLHCSDSSSSSTEFRNLGQRIPAPLRSFHGMGD